jgi:hypothetical protein
MPSLKADGSLRPDIRWNPRSPPAVVVVSTVDREAPEKRLKKAAVLAGTLLRPCAICWADAAMGWLSAASSAVI